MAKACTEKNASSAHLGFEQKLWLAADKLRNNMDAAEYKHVVLGLIFLKYISDTFEEHRAKLLAGEGDYAGANPEDPDEYKAENVFWVPADARWSHLQASAKQPTIGKTVDDAMVAIERDNPRLKGVLPKDYARPGLDKHRFGELIDLIATIDLIASNQPSSPTLLPAEEGGFVFATVTPRQVLKDAFVAKILDDGQVWIDMLDHRNLLSHTYSPVVFEKAVQAIHSRYLAGIEQLHDFMQGEVMK